MKVTYGKKSRYNEFKKENQEAINENFIENVIFDTTSTEKRGSKKREYLKGVLWEKGEDDGLKIENHENDNGD